MLEGERYQNLIIMRVFIVVVCLALYIKCIAQPITVKDPAALKNAVSAAKPGDVIILANGEWKDARLALQGRGTERRPILVRPQTPGGVRLTGSSTLDIAGEYLVVKDLHFTNGTARKNDVINFRLNNDNLANHCRITGFVIDNYSQPDRFANDNWVVLWGKNNRVDHCTFVNKMNMGPTLIVELNDERSQENYHSIDSNYFKGRQRLGSNGGETMRIGVSKYSLTPSRTRVVSNYFERCNGEVEIVSVKSGENQVSFNTFFECEGSVVLRHGSRNIVEGNLFLGNKKPFTGGVRVINPGHQVFNNVFRDLEGDDFRAALSVMNGVPNSLINRYYQVKDADIHHNTYINCSSILFGAGKDAERTLAPENVRFRNNLIVAPRDTIYKDNNGGTGVLFMNNAVAQAKMRSLPKGFKLVSVKIARIKSMDLPLPVADAGANTQKMPLLKLQAAGASWWKPSETQTGVGNKRIIVPLINSAKLPGIVASAAAGDTIELSDAGSYKVTEELHVSKAVVITAAKGTGSRPLLQNASEKNLNAFMVIEDGADLVVNGIAFAGSNEGFGDVGAGIITSAKPMVRHYKLSVDNCEFYNFNESSFAGIKALKSSYADSILVGNSIFRNISGSGIDLAAEKDDKGTYNAEYTIIKNCIFTNILGSALNLYRGGNDESTLGPFLVINHCTFNEVDNREQGAVLRLLGVQNASITNSIFSFSGQGGRSVQFQESRYDNLKVDYCNLYQSGRIQSFYGRLTGPNIYQLDPLYEDPKSRNFSLKAGSELLNKSSSGGALGAMVTKPEKLVLN